MAWVDGIGNGQWPVDPFEAWLDDSGQAPSFLELNEVEHEERLALSQPFCSGRETPRTLPSSIVEPVIAVGRHLELAEPAEHCRRRCRDRDRASEPANRRIQVVVAGKAGGPLLGCGVPVPGNNVATSRWLDDQIRRRRGPLLRWKIPLEAADESRHECLGLAEGKQMTARKWFRLQA